MLALGARRIAGQPALFAQTFEVRAASGQHLVDVCLVTGVEDDRIVWRVEYPVQRQRQLDDPEVRPQVSPGRSNLVDQELANLGSQIAQLLLGKVLQISGSADLFKHHVSLRSDHQITT